MPNSEKGYSIPLIFLILLALYGAGSYAYSKIPAYLNQDQNQIKKEIIKPPTDYSDPQGYVIFRSPTHYLGSTNISKDSFSFFNTSLTQLYPSATTTTVTSTLYNPTQTKLVIAAYYWAPINPLSPPPPISIEYYLLSIDGKTFKKLEIQNDLRKIAHPTFPITFSVNKWGSDDNSIYLTAYVRKNPQEVHHFNYNFETSDLTEIATEEAQLKLTLTRDPKNPQIMYSYSPSKNFYLKHQSNNDFVELFDKNSQKITEAHLGTFATSPKENITTPPEQVSPFESITFSSDEQDILFTIQEGAYTKNPIFKWKTLNIKTGELKTIKTLTPDEAQQMRWPVIWKKP